jgi:hypothetical protein
VTWAFAVILTLVITVLAYVVTRSLPRDRSIWGPPLVALGVSPLLWCPWWLPALWHGAGSLLLMESGRQPYPAVGFTDLLLGRLGAGVSGPWWLGAMLFVLAVLALIPRPTRIPVLVAWLVAAVAALTAAALSVVPLPLPGGSVRPGLSVMVVVIQGCFVLAAVLGAQGLVTILRRSQAEHHQVLLVGLAIVAVVIPAIGLGWFVWHGPGRLDNAANSGIPAYMTDSTTASDAHGILVIRGDVAQGLRYSIWRGDGDTLGENEIKYAAQPDPGFTADVQALVSRPTPQVVSDLADAGIHYVVLPAPADGDVAAGLDATDGLVQASAESRTTRAWSVAPPVDPHALDGPGSWMRTILLALQAIALLVVLVLCLPTWRTSRSARDDS